jgi:hypothetical protein
MRRQPTCKQLAQSTQYSVLDRLSGYNYLHARRVYVFLLYVFASFVPIVGTIWILINNSRRYALGTDAAPPPTLDELSTRRKTRELRNSMLNESKGEQVITQFENISAETKNSDESEMDLDALKKATDQAIKRHETK